MPERDAVPEVETAITERKKLGAQEVFPAEGTQIDRLTGKKRWWFWGSSILWQALIPALFILTV